MTVVETNRATINKYLETLVARGPYQELFADDIHLQLNGNAQDMRGAQAAEGFIRWFHEQAFDAQPELKSVLVDGDKAAIEADFVGRHIADFLGKPATGKTVRVSYSVHYDLAAGQITALRIYLPVDLLLKQLED